ncbi:MAG TPA: carotenoid oxygenase family protein [Myxococcota bacterium]|nr:carotenoid oxygenase family protein [Myxococcota bacterium]
MSAALESSHAPTFNARWTSGRRSLSCAHGYRTLRVEGRLPLDLVGTCLRSGPGQFEKFGIKIGHPFEADGHLTGVRFDGRGSAFGAARMVESDDILEERRVGRLLWGSDASVIRRLRAGLTSRTKNTGNTAVWRWGERVFTQVESALPLEIDPDTLETLGETDFGGVLGRTFSAHPHRVAERRATYNFGIRYGVRTKIDLFELPDVGAARRLQSFRLPWNSMVHDFVATRRHAVFVIGPARLRLGRAMFQAPPFDEWFAWEPKLGTEVIVVDLDDPEKIRRLATEPFWCWHLANGFDSGESIIVDLARYTDMSSFKALASGAEIAPPVLQRMTIDLPRGSVRIEARPGDCCEFPRVHPGFEGSRHRYVWGMHGTNAGREGVARFDLDSGRSDVFWADAGGFVSEPIVAPRAGGGELDAWVLAQVYDLRADAHYVAVLDARDPAAGPVAKVWFDQALPTPFHGTWLPRR